MAWTPEQKRRSRFVTERERYVRDCAYTGQGERSGVAFVTAAVITSYVRAELFGTLTFPATFGDDERRRSASRAHVGRWFPSRWVMAYERHKSGLLHAHLVAADDGGRRRSFTDAWRIETGGFARLEAVRSAEQVTDYVAKYIVKGEQGELYFSPEVVDVPEEFEVRRGFVNPWRPPVPGANL